MPLQPLLRVRKDHVMMMMMRRRRWREEEEGSQRGRWSRRRRRRVRLDFTLSVMLIAPG